MYRYYITATTENGQSAKIKVTVLKKGSAAIPVTKVAISKLPTKMNVGATKQLKAKVSPGTATGAVVTWKSSKSSVLAVDKAGTITAIKEGTAKITMKPGGESASVTITVTAPVKKISFASKSASLKVKKSTTLLPIITLGSANYTATPKLTWTSSNIAATVR